MKRFFVPKKKHVVIRDTIMFIIFIQEEECISGDKCIPYMCLAINTTTLAQTEQCIK